MDMHCCAMDTVYLILGLYCVLIRIPTFMEFVRNTFMLKKLNLKERYGNGNDSWALITGCTSGIGEEMVH